MPKPKVALILGAGFSCESGLPPTRKVVDTFLQSPPSRLDPQIEDEITNQLKKFWKYVFNFDGHGDLPSLEDHFTVLDLAANFGRNIGLEYTPRKLRAIRRFSIHRIFQILDTTYHHSDSIAQLLSLALRTRLSIISTNWDIVVENHLRASVIPYSYGLEVEDDAGRKMTVRGVPVLMLHGSANWIYCDCCRRLYVGAPGRGKDALHALIYITRDDFQQLCPEKTEVIHLVSDAPRNAKYCVHCKNRLSARIATFSYRKEVSIPQFQAIWQKAFSALRDSDRWLFVGYSLPEADFEFRHLLKSAEKASILPKSASVILMDDPQAAQRFRRFFGLPEDQVHQRGLSHFTTSCMDDWLKAVQTKALRTS
jgi:NAD-dependent SIR2 family protein deacetylase